MRTPANRPPPGDALCGKVRQAHFSYRADRPILYALGIGLGGDPRDLPYVYEREQRVFPTFATVARPHDMISLRELDIDFGHVLHGEEQLVMLKPMPPEAELRIETALVAVVDKGAAVGSLLAFENRLRLSHDGTELARTTTVIVARADGGRGGFGDVPQVRPRPPTRRPDTIVEIPTRPEQALLYRLSGDLNSLHADPESARRAGFSRPILHGLCSFGIAARALASAAGVEAQALASLGLRFAGPLYPGETLRFEIWQDGNDLQFEAAARERHQTVLHAGVASLRQQTLDDGSSSTSQRSDAQP